MFIPYKDRKIKNGQLVAVHYNSHRKTFSIVNMNSENTTGDVLGYADNITLVDCYFKIEKSKQKLVRENNVKERHAFVVGHIKDFSFTDMDNEMYYKPTLLDSFINKSEKDSKNPTYLETVSEVSFCLDNKKPIVKFNY